MGSPRSNDATVKPNDPPPPHVMCVGTGRPDGVWRRLCRQPVQTEKITSLRSSPLRQEPQRLRLQQPEPQQPELQ
ncbi:hypothetical protein ACFFX0_10785 [Citricoccus parietis]|uniref:Uncharacterized protein n=1 Tax=Citricoccus parietis TaxID=592307 RepID=A0ABV5FZ20_9MICC